MASMYRELIIANTTLFLVYRDVKKTVKMELKQEYMDQELKFLVNVIKT